MRKPFYKANRQTWYVQLDGVQHKLAQGDKEATREQAEREWHHLADGQAPVTDRTTVEALVDQFLAETKLTVAESTHDWYLFHCQRFVKTARRICAVPQARLTACSVPSSAVDSAPA